MSDSSEAEQDQPKQFEFDIFEDDFDLGERTCDPNDPECEACQ